MLARRITKDHVAYSLTLCLCIALMNACNSNNAYKTPNVKFSLDEQQIASFEKDVDHKGIIMGLDSPQSNSFEKGEKIYNNICSNCHGNPAQEGSVPTAFKFWKDKFKVGKDPYTMYLTLTRGYGGMPPHPSLTPVEKYDVIYYIREEFIRKKNPQEFFNIDDSYLASIPKGNTKGPMPRERKPWAEMDYGNFLINTYEVVPADAPPREISKGPAPLKDENLTYANFAYKGIAVRLDEGQGGVAAGKAWMIFDHDLMRIAGGWTGKGFIDWEAILLNGKHNISPRTVGDLHFSNPVEPGWADPSTGTFDDPRFQAVDKRRFGPLPRSWAQYKGLYRHNGKAIITYSVGNAMVLEQLGMEGEEGQPVFTRTLNIASSKTPLKMRVARTDVQVSIKGNVAELKKENGFHVMYVPANRSVSVKIFIADQDCKNFTAITSASKPAADLTVFTRGGKPQFQESLVTNISTDTENGAFKVDRMELPYQSPWKNQMRLSGIDFLEDKDKAVICATDGDVWLVKGITSLNGKLTWKRIAAGLFQPLGIRVVDKKIMVTCRDQLVRLHDLNGDEEIDYYEAFNSDHQVTNHFHEFAMGLQTDRAGNFYYAKSARHARRALVPQHGTLIKVSRDGQRSTIVANGFRAANGVCINPDGSFLVTDQEGHWNPMNRINWVTGENKFYGNMFGYDPSKDSSDTGMEPPMLWVERDIDRSPSELLWVDSKQWGPLNGSLLSFSYGYGKVFIVPHEKVDGQIQGGLFELPLPKFTTGVMRGRFNPGDGQLYVCGLSAWGSSQPDLGGFYRIRYNGASSIVPTGLNANKQGINIKFSHRLDVKNVDKTSSFRIQTWDLKRSRRYGSDHHNIRDLPVTNVKVSADKKEVFLTIPDIKPTWVMKINYTFISPTGDSLKGQIQNTIHKLR